MKRICARGLIVTDDGLSVIFRRKITDGVKKEYYSIPGGGIEENESCIEGLKRELREELNIEVNVLDLAFTKETDDRIEYFFNCEYISGDFSLNGEELDRMSESNYYQPKFLKLDELNNVDILDEVKAYFNK